VPATIATSSVAFLASFFAPATNSTNDTNKAGGKGH
jgi:hypothetical protein